MIESESGACPVCHYPAKAGHNKKTHARLLAKEMRRPAREKKGGEPARGRWREATVALLLAGAAGMWTAGEKPEPAKDERAKTAERDAAEQRKIQNAMARLDAAQKVLRLMARERGSSGVPATPDLRAHSVTKEGFYPLQKEELQLAQDDESARRWQATYDEMREQVVIEQGSGEVFVYLPGDDTVDNLYLTEVSEDGTQISLLIETADGEEHTVGSIQSETGEPLTVLDHRRFEEDAARWIEHGTRLGLAEAAAMRARVELSFDTGRDEPKDTGI